MAHELLEITRNGNIAVVSFDRPEKLNALNHDLMLEITRAARAFREDVETRAVVFTGKGKHFSAGADLRDADRTGGVGATLLRWGFYDEVVDPEELMERALAMAEDYARQPPLPAQMIKQSVNAVISALDRSIMHMDHDQWMLTASTDDFREGIQSFLEKRKPEFTGN